MPIDQRDGASDLRLATPLPVQLPKGMKAVNLLPTDLRGAPKASAAITARSDVPRGPGAFIVLGALAFGVLALAGYVLTTNTIKDRQAELSQLAAQQRAAEQRVAALKPYAEFDQLAKGRVATLRDLAGKRFDWDQTLRDLSRALPRDVTIKSLNGSLGGATPAAGTATATTTPSVNLTGCTRNQKSVARLMARLATVNGVTRVKLANSTKSAAAAAPTTGAVASEGATPSDTSAAPCGEGRRPDFNVTIEFAGITSDAGPAASAPAAPATAAASATPAATPATGGTQASTTATATTQGGAK
jgi:Tfp pilus assembly protein PilN